MKKYTFWRENLTANEFQLNKDEIRIKFISWMKRKDKEWLDYYSVDLVGFFISDKEGLNSHSDDVDELSSKLQKTKWDYLKSIGIKINKNNIMINKIKKIILSKQRSIDIKKLKRFVIPKNGKILISSN